MKEGLDLNALRTQKRGDKPLSEMGEKLSVALERDRRLNEGTATERIVALEAEIERLEAESNEPTPLARFNSLSPDEQQAEMVRELTGVVPEAEWDMNIYRAGLEVVSRKNPADLRIIIAKSKLEALRGEASNT
ncbi:MAG: hypothetical protein WBB68_01870 [Candidatus Moraniibacteriota bacterium]